VHRPSGDWVAQPLKLGAILWIVASERVLIAWCERVLIAWCERVLIFASERVLIVVSERVLIVVSEKVLESERMLMAGKDECDQSELLMVPGLQVLVQVVDSSVDIDLSIDAADSNTVDNLSDSVVEPIDEVYWRTQVADSQRGELGADWLNEASG
jgi:hypothetical protein